MHLLYAYRKPVLSETKKSSLLSLVRQKVSPDIRDIHSEYCFYVEAKEPLTPEETGLLQWLLRETFEPENFSSKSFLTHNASRVTHYGILEVGPRMNFTTAWSTNAVSVCHACGLSKVTRIERSRRYKIVRSQKSNTPPNPPLSKGGHGGVNSDLISSLITRHSSLFYDRMTECPYPERLRTFDPGIKPEPVFEVKIL
ncbi:MAG: hypothetical protein M1508_08665, partial [Nitrospirae bacterium]|nr:hypothetical protein [Nitrospirota bacterium]